MTLIWQLSGWKRIAFDWRECKGKTKHSYATLAVKLTWMARQWSLYDSLDSYQIGYVSQKQILMPGTIRAIISVVAWRNCLRWILSAVDMLDWLLNRQPVLISGRNGPAERQRLNIVWASVRYCRYCRRSDGCLIIRTKNATPVMSRQPIRRGRLWRSSVVQTSLYHWRILRWEDDKWSWVLYYKSPWRRSINTVKKASLFRFH